MYHAHFASYHHPLLPAAPSYSYHTAAVMVVVAAVAAAAVVAGGVVAVAAAAAATAVLAVVLVVVIVFVVGVVDARFGLVWFGLVCSAVVAAYLQPETA